MFFFPWNFKMDLLGYFKRITHSWFLSKYICGWIHKAEYTGTGWLTAGIIVCVKYPGIDKSCHWNGYLVVGIVYDPMSLIVEVSEVSGMSFAWKPRIFFTCVKFKVYVWSKKYMKRAVTQRLMLDPSPDIFWKVFLDPKAWVFPLFMFFSPF